jgi:hypothetical protein
MKKILLILGLSLSVMANCTTAVNQITVSESQFHNALAAKDYESCNKIVNTVKSSCMEIAVNNCKVTEKMKAGCEAAKSLIISK